MWHTLSRWLESKSIRFVLVSANTHGFGFNYHVVLYAGTHVVRSFNQACCSIFSNHIEQSATWFVLILWFNRMQIHRHSQSFRLWIAFWWFQFCVACPATSSIYSSSRACANLLMQLYLLSIILHLIQLLLLILSFNCQCWMLPRPVNCLSARIIPYPSCILMHSSFVPCIHSCLPRGGEARYFLT